MIATNQILICPMAGFVRITINTATHNMTYEKDLSPREMRILAIRLFQAAEEQESTILFARKKGDV